MLLDLAMPKLDGAEVVRIIRAESDTPIIVVSGERDRSVPAELLDLGADDYVRKGVPSNELLARIRAVVRRTSAGRPTTAPVPTAVDSAAAGISTSAATRSAGTSTLIPATAIEFRLLATLIERLGELVPHADLLAAGWPDVRDPDPLWLKPHLARLRDKLNRGWSARADRRARRRLPTRASTWRLTRGERRPRLSLPSRHSTDTAVALTVARTLTNLLE